MSYDREKLEEIRSGVFSAAMAQDLKKDIRPIPEPFRGTMGAIIDALRSQAEDCERLVILLDFVATRARDVVGEDGAVPLADGFGLLREIAALAPKEPD